jgi:hypothetical protein
MTSLGATVIADNQASFEMADKEIGQETFP